MPLFSYLELIGIGESGGDDLLPESGDGVAGLPYLLDLLAGPERANKKR